MFSQEAMQQPSQPFPSLSAATPTDGPVRAGDVFQVAVGAPVPPVYSPVSIEAVTAHLQASGIADDIGVTFQPGPPHAQGGGRLVVTGAAAEDWRSGAELCGAILKLVSETGYVLHTGNWLSCVITPIDRPRFEIPEWLLLLALGALIWWLWKKRE
jgi:hypothetical protein